MKVTYRRSGRRTKRNPSLLTLVNPSRGKASPAKSKKTKRTTAAKAGKTKTASVSKAAIKKAVAAEVKKAVAKKIPKQRIEVRGKGKAAKAYRVFGGPAKSPPKPHWTPMSGYYRPGIREAGVSDDISYSYKHPATGSKVKVSYARRPAGWYGYSGYEFTPKSGRSKGKTITVGPSWRYVKNEEKSMARKGRKTRSRKATSRKRTTRRGTKRLATSRKRGARRNPRRSPIRRRRVLVLNAMPKRRSRRARRNPSLRRRSPARRARARRNPIRRRRRGYRRNPGTKATWLKFGLAGFGSYLVGRIVANVIQQNAASLPAGVGQFGAVLGTSLGAVISYYASKKIKPLQKYQTPIVIGAVIAVADVILDSIASQIPGGGYLARPASAPLLPAAGVAGWQGTHSYWGDSGGRPVALTARALSEYVREPAGLGEYIATGMGATADPHGLDDGVVRGGLFGEPGDDGDFDIVLDD